MRGIVKGWKSREMSFGARRGDNPMANMFTDPPVVIARHSFNKLFSQSNVRRVKAGVYDRE